MQVSRGRKLWLLFTTMLYISTFTFGGGFVIVTFMQKNFVDRLGWLTQDEMLDITAIAQSSPGAIAVNAAIQVGWKIAGLAGMLVAVLGTILPPMLILTGVSFFYDRFVGNPYVALVLKGMQAAVVALLMDVTLNMGHKVLAERKWIYWLVMLVAFVVNFFFDVNVIYIIVGAALVGLLQVLVLRQRERRAAK